MNGTPSNMHVKTWFIVTFSVVKRNESSVASWTPRAWSPLALRALGLPRQAGKGMADDTLRTTSTRT